MSYADFSVKGSIDGDWQVEWNMFSDLVFYWFDVITRGDIGLKKD